MTSLRAQVRLIVLLGYVVLPGARTQGGSLSGTLLRPDGKPAAGVTIVLRKLDAGEMREQSSASDGAFVFSAVSPGFYTVDATTDDFTAGTFSNVGPSQIEPKPDQKVVLKGVPTPPPAKDPSLVVPVLVALILSGSLFWFYDRINLSYLRVPIVSLALWAILPWALYDTQHALLTLQEADAFWVGVWFAFGAVAIWQSRAALAGYFRAEKPDAHSPNLPAWTSIPIGCVYLLTLGAGGCAFAVNSMRSGTPERQQFVFLGIAAGTAVLLVLRWLVAWISRRIAGNRWLKLREEVTCGFATLLVGLITYAWLFQNRLAALKSGTSPDLGSPIIHLLFLIGELCLILSALCLWLDKHRVPLLGVPVLLVFIGIMFHKGDHIFATLPISSVPRSAPAEAIAGHDRVIVVAAAGGGVQAAAWTARVLGALAEENSSFSPAVRLLSGVSGGSVGVFYFLNTYPSSKGGNGWTSERAFRTAALPLLDAVAWGLVGRDILRVFPFGATSHDRGWVVDRVLAARSQVGQAPLSRWAVNVPAGLPAVLLNATEVETGRPLVFATTELHSACIVDFSGAYHRDVEITTAVRLSASFPYVTPVARPEANGQTLPHVADGGYYDNYGLFSLMDWLDQVLSSNLPVPEILILRIEAFPPGRAETDDQQAWPFQVWAPMSTMMSVRAAAQNQRNEAQLALFQKHYKQLGSTINTVLFRYQPPSGCPAPPLSWDLSPVEIECLSRAWHGETMRSAANLVNSFLSRP